MSVSASGEEPGCRQDASWCPRLWMNKLRCNCRFIVATRSGTEPSCTRSSCGKRGIDSVHDGANNSILRRRINWRSRSMPRTRNLFLTEPQAACLIALRHGRDAQSKIAIEAKLGLRKATAALRALAELGLAERDQAKGWHATPRGKTCSFNTVPDRPPRRGLLPGPGGRRLLALLDRPMRGRQIVEKLGITHQGVRQLLSKLHAYGHVRFADPGNPFWMVMRP